MDRFGLTRMVLIEPLDQGILARRARVRDVAALILMPKRMKLDGRVNQGIPQKVRRRTEKVEPFLGQLLGRLVAA